MKLWLDILELAMMILLTASVVIGAGLLVAYLLSRLLGML